MKLGVGLLVWGIIHGLAPAMCTEEGPTHGGGSLMDSYSKLLCCGVEPFYDLKQEFK